MEAQAEYATGRHISQTNYSYIIAKKAFNIKDFYAVRLLAICNLKAYVIDELQSILQLNILNCNDYRKYFFIKDVISNSWAPRRSAHGFFVLKRAPCARGAQGIAKGNVSCL